MSWRRHGGRLVSPHTASHGEERQEPGPIREILGSPKRSSKRDTPATKSDRDTRKDTPAKGHTTRRGQKQGPLERRLIAPRWNLSNTKPRPPETSRHPALHQNPAPAPGDPLEIDTRNRKSTGQYGRSLHYTTVSLQSVITIKTSP